MKLSVRLLILVLIAALPVLALQVQGLVQDREQLKVAIAQQALDLARLAAAQQDQFIEAARHLLAAAAQLPEVQNRDAPACDKQMAELLVQFPTITSIGATAPDGVPFCSGLRGFTDMSFADRLYFQQALRNRSLAISGYIVEHQTGRPQLNFAYPALNYAGEVQAVVVLAFSLGAARAAATAAETPLLGTAGGRRRLASRHPPDPSQARPDPGRSRARRAAGQTPRPRPDPSPQARRRRRHPHRSHLLTVSRTLILVKPDAFERALTGEVLARFERKGLRIVELRKLQADEAIANEHYAEHTEKPFFGELVEFITGGPLVAAVLEGHEAVAAARQVIGSTNPVEAAPGSIRGDFALEVTFNMVHGSDSDESAEREIAIWFPDL